MQNYFSSYRDCVEESLKRANAKGFETNETDVFVLVSINTSKPSNGKTTKYHLPLYKDGESVEQYLHVQVYNRGVEGNTYELNCYIS